MTWSESGYWSVGEPGFSDTTDPLWGFDPAIQLSGTPNVDYRICFEIIDIAPNFYIKTDDETWVYVIGQRYNLSQWNEHHVHMHYRAYVDQYPEPDYPFYVTYRLVDEIDPDPYEASEPFVCVFNVPAPAVETTTPLYRGTLSSIHNAELIFTFHREITVAGGPPVTITDEETQTQDYYTGYFDYQVQQDQSEKDTILVLNQIGGTLPEETWLQVSLTEHLKDAEDTDQPAIPFTQFVYTPADTPTPGDCDDDGDVDLQDFLAFQTCYTGPGGPVDPGCECVDFDGDDDVDLQDFLAFQTAYTGPG